MVVASEALETIAPIMSSLYLEDRLQETQLIEILDTLGLEETDLQYLTELSPYLILDGHRSGMKGPDNLIAGYIEGAIFSLKFATILRELGGKQCTFLIHTLRNYKTTERMKAIFGAIEDVGEEFIDYARMNEMRLSYYGKNVHTDYAMADLINAAEFSTNQFNDFHLNFVTNYSEEWAVDNMDELKDLPEISVVGRFTKGHYAGVNLVSKIQKSNFTYIQQASIAKNWSHEDIVILILTLLKSHLSLKGMVGGKTYTDEEKDMIYQNREKELWENNIELIRYNEKTPKKKIITFHPQGPVTVNVE